LAQNIAELIDTRKPDYIKVVIQSMESLWGRHSTTAVIYHLGGEEVLKDPNLFTERLETIFKEGTEIVLKHILKKLETETS